MAYKVLDNRSDTHYTIRRPATSPPRTATIVIFFTDGQPGDYAYSNQYAEANDVVASALPLKTAGAKIFSIGVFGESDGNPLTYAMIVRPPPRAPRRTGSSSAAGWRPTKRAAPTTACAASGVPTARRRQLRLQRERHDLRLHVRGTPPTIRRRRTSSLLRG